MVFRCILGVLGSHQVMSMCHMSMMRCLFVSTSFMMLCGFPMVLSSMLVVRRGFLMMLSAFMLSHSVLSPFREATGNA